MKRLPGLFLSVLIILCSPLLFGQQPDDAQATQPPDNGDIVAQIQQLRADVERLSQQLDRLNNEVKSLQAGKTSPARIARGRNTATTTAPPTPPTISAAAPSPPNEEKTPITILMFRDGRRIETRNYAIVGESIWAYTEQDSRKYRVADLDVEATTKVNSDRGVLFQLPPAR